ncbi:peptidase E [Winogradskyella sp. PAMC22761]|nr:peptidase E [Winogradskyella sp. PAMC22761]
MKLLHFLIAFLIFPVLIGNSDKHEYYVSVTEVEYVKEQQSLQIISQIFINDLETLIRKRYDESITLDIEDESRLVDDYIERYLTDKLKVKVNGDFLSFNFLGKEYKDDIVYCYLEIENVSKVNSIEITNQVLFDVLPSQQNIVRLKLLNKNKSFLLVPENDTCLLNF